MKRLFKLFLVGAMLTTTMVFSAAAASFTSSADALNQMGLFSGTGSGYELDRAPTRAEAAVMLVRLLGGEQDATEASYETPFTDVPDWAAPYVGWLYEKGLTAGETGTTYGTNNVCTAQMYSAFLLRSLGYQDTPATDGGSAEIDFQYASAIDFATEKGVADYVNHDAGNFLRDHVVAMSYTALALEPKGGAYDTLLDQLIASGAVDADKAANTKANFSAYHAYMALNQQQAEAESMAMKMKAAMTFKMNGEPVMDADVDVDVQVIVDPENLDASKFAMTGTMSMDMPEELGEDVPQSVDMEAYYVDGSYYIKTGDQKIKMLMSLEDIIAGLNMDMMSNAVPISMLESISQSGDDSFKIVIAPGFMNGMMDAMMGSMGMADLTVIEVGKLDITVTGANGELGSMKLEMDASATFAGETAEFTMTVDYTDMKVGDDVVITLPTDLDTYTEIPGL